MEPFQKRRRFRRRNCHMACERSRRQALVPVVRRAVLKVLLASKIVDVEIVDAVGRQAAVVPAVDACGVRFVLARGPLAFAGWAITPRASVALAAGPLTGIRELSGVTYLGPRDGGLGAVRRDSG